MRISVAALAAMFAADPVAAYCTETPYVSSTTDVYTTVHGPLSSFDFDQSGAPATSSRSDNAQNVDLSYNFSVSSALTQSFGSFDIDTSVGGNTDIVDITSYGASAGAVGDLGDCLTFGGHVGTGRAHIPLHLTGGAAIGWTITGQYVPPPSVNPAEVQFRILCFVSSSLRLRVPGSAKSLSPARIESRRTDWFTFSGAARSCAASFRNASLASGRTPALQIAT